MNFMWLSKKKVNFLFLLLHLFLLKPKCPAIRHIVMLVSPVVKRQRGGMHGTCIQPTHLTFSDPGLCDVFKDRMQKEVTQKLKADEQRYTQTQHDLKDYLYLVPNKNTHWTLPLNTPSKTDVMIYESLRIRGETGNLDCVLFRLIMTKIDSEWKLEAKKPPEDLSGNIYAKFRSIRITVKRAKDGMTELVYLRKGLKVARAFTTAMSST